MTRKRVLLFVLLLMFMFALGKLFIHLSQAQEITIVDLRLQKEWEIRLTQQIQNFSLPNQATLLARTSSHLYAIDIDTGRLMWKYETGWLIDNEPAVYAGDSAFVTDSHYLWRINAQNGLPQWKRHLYSPETAKIIGVLQNIVVVFDTQQFFAYAVGDGSLLWHKSVCRNSFQAYLEDNFLYFPCPEIQAIDLPTGETLWKDESVRISSSTSYVDGLLYFSQSSSSIAAYNLQQQNLLEKAPITSSADQHLIISGNFLFSTDNGTFCTLTRLPLHVLWCIHDSGYWTFPTVFDDKVYALNEKENRIVAYELDSGKIAGQIKLFGDNLFFPSGHVMMRLNNLLILSNGSRIYAFSLQP